MLPPAQLLPKTGQQCHGDIATSGKCCPVQVCSRTCAASSLNICWELPIPFIGMLATVRAAVMEVAGLRAAVEEDAVLYQISPPFSFLLSLCSVPGSFPCPSGLPCCPQPFHPPYSPFSPWCLPTSELSPEGRRRIFHARLLLQSSGFPTGKTLNAAATVLLQHPLCLQPLPCISSSSLSVQGLAEAFCFLSCWRKRAQPGLAPQIDSFSAGGQLLASSP